MNPIQAAHHLARRALCQEFGKRIEAHKAASQDERSRCMGAQTGLVQAAQKIDEQKAYWQALHKDGTLEQSGEQHTLGVIDQCSGSARSLAQGAQLQTLVCQGKIACAEALLDICETLFQAEDALLKAPHEPEKPVGKLRKAGEHPGDSLAQRRRQAPLKSKAGEAASAKDP
jgi:hypothetical protein